MLTVAQKLTMIFLYLYPFALAHYAKRCLKR